MRILIVEDNPRIAGFLRKGLVEEGYTVQVEENGDRAFQRAASEEYGAAVVDVMIPGRNGIDLVRDLRDAGVRTPVLLLTARDRIDDKIAGLDAGADDYLTKPFDFAELTARLRALLRRSSSGAPAILRWRDLELDPAKREVHRAGELIELTPKEFALLEFLLRSQGRPLSRAMILNHVWGIDFDPGTNMVDVFINSLRNKVDPERAMIRTLRGVGYMIEAPDE